jgi:hypothetical protein
VGVLAVRTPYCYLYYYLKSPHQRFHQRALMYELRGLKDSFDRLWPKLVPMTLKSRIHDP